MKIHLDLDSFFVSAHRIYDKSLLNKPVVVVKRNDKEIFKNQKAEVLNLNKGAFTGDIVVSEIKDDKSYFLEEGKVRGIVVTASYEARELGIKTGTTLKEALEIYPNLIVLAPDYKLYHTLSYKLKEFLKTKIPAVEQFSIDEFFGDLEGWVSDEMAEEFCLNLQDEICKKFSLPVSIGIAKSKWIAKLATSYIKPKGVLKIDNVDEFIKDIPIGKFPGIGKRIERRLKQKGILTLKDVKENKEYLYSWGKPGIELYKRVCGIDNEEVKEREKRKSIGISRRFDPVFCRRELIRRVHILCRYLSFLILKHKLNPTFYYLKIKYKDKTSSKAHVRIHRLFNELLLKEIMSMLFYRADEKEMAVISISISVSRFKKETNLFDYKEDFKFQKLNEAIFKIREKFGVASLVGAEELTN